MGANGTDDLDRCAYCGSKLPMEEWCPVVTTRADDGSKRVLSFCDESCEGAWLRDEGNAAVE